MTSSSVPGSPSRGSVIKCEATESQVGLAASLVGSGPSEGSFSGLQVRNFNHHTGFQFAFQIRLRMLVCKFEMLRSLQRSEVFYEVRSDGLR